VRGRENTHARSLAQPPIPGDSRNRPPEGIRQHGAVSTAAPVKRTAYLPSDSPTSRPPIGRSARAIYVVSAKQRSFTRSATNALRTRLGNHDSASARFPAPRLRKSFSSALHQQPTRPERAICTSRGRPNDRAASLPLRTMFDSDVERRDDTPAFLGEQKYDVTCACWDSANPRYRLGRPARASPTTTSGVAFGLALRKWRSSGQPQVLVWLRRSSPPAARLAGRPPVARVTGRTAGRPARDHLVAASAHLCSVMTGRLRWRGASESLLARRRQAPCRPGVAFGRQSDR